MEYCSALKRKEILIHGTTWMNLEDPERSETSQLQKEIDCMIPKPEKERERGELQAAGGGWMRELLSHGDRVSA